MHVVDAAAADPASDYWAVREELRMYNPEYVCAAVCYFGSTAGGVVVTQRGCCHTDGLWSIKYGHTTLLLRHPQVAKPHVVALNKMDLEDAHVLQQEIEADIRRVAGQLKVAYITAHTHM